MQVHINAVRLSEELAQRGYQAIILSSNHIHDLQAKIESQYRQGLFNEEFFTEELAGFDFNIADSFAGSESIIIVAAPNLTCESPSSYRGNPTRVSFRRHTATRPTDKYRICWNIN